MTPDRIIAALEAYQSRLGVRGAPAARGDHDLNPDPDFRAAGPLVPAAVLVPLVMRRGAVTVMLTRRTAHLHDHAGQISFPGGRMDPGDDDPVATALRETEEETGLARERIAVVGRLDRYETRTGFAITPVVGLVRPPFELKPDPFEVAEIFEMPLGFVLRPENRVLHSASFQGTERHFWAVPFGARYIWGATAGMLVNLSEALL